MNVRSMEKLAWHKGDFSKITEEFYKVDWEAVFRGLNVHECYKLFLDYMQESVDRHVPIRGPPIDGRWLVFPPREILRLRNQVLIVQMLP